MNKKPKLFSLSHESFGPTKEQIDAFERGLMYLSESDMIEILRWMLHAPITSIEDCISFIYDSRKKIADKMVERMNDEKAKISQS